MAPQSTSYSPPPSPDRDAPYSPSMPQPPPAPPPSPPLESGPKMHSADDDAERRAQVTPDGGEMVVEDSSDEEPRGAGRSRASVFGEVDLDSVSTPPSLWQSSPAHIECTAAAPEYDGDLPSHAMRRLDVGQRSAVGDFQSAVRNLADYYCGPSVGAARGARREKKALEKRARSAAQRMWVAVKREDDRWKDLATASHYSLDKQRLLLATLRSQEKRLASCQ